jgi:hypothetical protein
MSWLQKLERRLTPLAIVNITMYIVIGQTFVYLTTMFGLLDGSRLMLVPALALQGEWWRLLTFVADPPSAHWLFIAFALYFLYLTGNALENQWGPLRFNLFLLVGYVLTVGTSFITPYAVASNLFIAGSIFLAFAHLHPNFTMYVFLVLPIQIKWLALLTWIFLAWSFFTGDLSTRLAIGIVARKLLPLHGPRPLGRAARQPATGDAPDPPHGGRAQWTGSPASLPRLQPHRPVGSAAGFSLLFEVCGRPVLLPGPHSEPRARADGRR